MVLELVNQASRSQHSSLCHLSLCFWAKVFENNQKPVVLGQGKGLWWRYSRQGHWYLATEIKHSQGQDCHVQLNKLCTAHPQRHQLHGLWGAWWPLEPCNVVALHWSRCGKPGTGTFCSIIRFEAIPLIFAHLCVSAPFLSVIHLLFTPLLCGPTWLPIMLSLYLTSFLFQHLPLTIINFYLLLFGRENLCPRLETCSCSV